MKSKWSFFLKLTKRFASQERRKISGTNFKKKKKKKKKKHISPPPNLSPPPLPLLFNHLSLSPPQKNTQQSTWVQQPRYIEMKVFKKETSDYWDRLLSVGGKRHWLSVDWGKWKDEDESDEELNLGGAQQGFGDFNVSFFFFFFFFFFIRFFHCSFHLLFCFWF